MTFLAILSPAQAKGPFLVDCYNEEPWRSLRKPFAYRAVDPRTGRTRTEASPRATLVVHEPLKKTVIVVD
jgi:hypothetical protein